MLRDAVFGKVAQVCLDAEYLTIDIIFFRSGCGTVQHFWKPINGLRAQLLHGWTGATGAARAPIFVAGLWAKVSPLCHIESRALFLTYRFSLKYANRPACVFNEAFNIKRRTNSTATFQASTAQKPVLLPSGTIATAQYKAPSTGVLSRLPSSLVPHTEHIRLNKPVGTYYLYLPCLLSTLLAGPLSYPVPPPSTILGISAFFLLGCAIFHGGACTWNDTLDRDPDVKTTRTRLRPLPQDAITANQVHT